MRSLPGVFKRASIIATSRRKSKNKGYRTHTRLIPYRKWLDKSSWLLIPAAICGLAAVVEIVRGIHAVDLQQAAISNTAICVAGVVTYALLLIVTGILMKRQITTELILIVGWVTMVAAELNALYAAEVFGLTQTVGLFVVAAVLALISLACYLAYYRLDAVKGYLDGAAPLVSVGVMTAVTLILLVSK